MPSPDADAGMTAPAIAALIEAQARAWEAGDADAVLAGYADEFEFIAPGLRVTSREHLRASAEAYLRDFVDIRVEIQSLLVDGDAVAVEWKWRETNRKTGAVNFADDAIIVHVRKSLIVYWREYIDGTFYMKPPPPAT